MGQLTNQYVSQSYQGLLNLANANTGLTTTLQTVTDGLGGTSPLQISQTQVNISGSFTINGSPVTGSSINTGSFVTTSSFNAYTSSIDTRIDGIEAKTGSYATTGSNTFIGAQIIEGNVTFPSNSFVSTDNVSGSLYLSSLNQGTLYLNADGGEGDVIVGYSAWQNSLKVKGGSTEITGSLGVTNIKGTGSLYLQPNQSDARYLEVYNTSPTDTHITASGGQIFLGDDQTYVKVDNYGSVERIDIVAGNELNVSSSVVNVTSSLHQSGTFYPDQVDWINSSITQETGSYVLTTDTSGITHYDTYQNVASALQPFINTGSFNRDGLITTGSAGGSQSITGSLDISGTLTATSASITYLETVYETASIIYSSGSNQFGDASNDTQTLWGTVVLPSGSLNITGSIRSTGEIRTDGAVVVGTSLLTNQIQNPAGVGDITISTSGINKVIIIDDVEVTGSLNVTGGITGSLFGTSSYATNALSSSHSVNSDTSISSSFAQTASFASNGGVTQLLAGPNITLSPISGKGQVTISSTGTGTGSFNTATGSYGSFYDTTTQINPVANTPNSMSFNETAITNGVSISGSISPFNTYIKTENAGVYNIQFSAQVDKTDGGTDNIDIWIRKNGIDLLDTATVLTLPTNNSKVVAAWNWFVQSAANDYYQLIWSSADTDMRLLAEVSSSQHPGIPSVIATANRVDQFLSNTGSFNGDFNGSFTGSLQGTASFASNIDKTGLITTGSAAGTQSITGSLILSGSAGPELDVKGDVIITGSVILSGSAGVELDVKGDQTNTGSLTVRSGSIFSLSNNTSLNVNNFYSSSEVGQANFIKGWYDNPASGGPLATQANYTGSLRVTGSNNIFSLPQARATGFGLGADQQGYISGSDNVIAANNAGIYMNTGSLLFPKISNNYVGQSGFIGMNFTTSSLSGGHPSISSNTIYGGSITINHNSGSIGVSTNLINAGALTSTQNFVTNTRPSNSGNILGNAATLNHISSSINFSQNLINSPLTINNHLSSSNITNNSFTFQNNAVFGGSTATGLNVWVSGSQSSNATRQIADNLIGGKNIIISSSFVSSSNSNLYASLIYGQTLIVSASHTTSGTGGSAFLGRYNDATSLHLAQDIVFAVGTGTGNATRRTGLYIDSGSNVVTSGSFRSIGNATVTGSLGVTGSVFVTGSVQGNVNNLTVASNTASLNLNDGNFFVLQLTGSIDTHINPSNIKAGQTVNIKLNTTGSGTVSFPSSVKQVSGSSYVPSTGTTTDIITLVSFDSTNLFLANVKNLI